SPRSAATRLQLAAPRTPRYSAVCPPKRTFPPQPRPRARPIVPPRSAMLRPPLGAVGPALLTLDSRRELRPGARGSPIGPRGSGAASDGSTLPEQWVKALAPRMEGPLAAGRFVRAAGRLRRSAGKPCRARGDAPPSRGTTFGSGGAPRPR